MGLPLLIGKARIKAFNFLCECVKKKNSWSSNLLSLDGGEILLKSIASTIPNYSMQCFLLSQCVCEELTKLMHIYWWGVHGKQESYKFETWNCIIMHY